MQAFSRDLTEVSIAHFWSGLQKQVNQSLKRERTLDPQGTCLRQTLRPSHPGGSQVCWEVRSGHEYKLLQRVLTLLPFLSCPLLLPRVSFPLYLPVPIASLILSHSLQSGHRDAQNNYISQPPLQLDVTVRCRCRELAGEVVCATPSWVSLGPLLGMPFPPFLHAAGWNC